MTDTQANVAADVEWNPRDIEPGETVWVYEYHNNHAIQGPNSYDVRISTGHIDGDGDMYLRPMDVRGSFARKWRRPAVVEPESEVEWNPNNLEEGTTIWVFADSGTVRGVPNPRGFDVRVVSRGKVDSDGEIVLGGPGPAGSGAYARKWRLPATDLQPEVKVGDKVKVLGCLGGARDVYRNAVMDKVLVVADKNLHPGRGLIEGAILVDLPEDIRVDGYSAGAIGRWGIVERASVDDAKVTVEAAPVEATEPPEPEPDWGAIIESWRAALNTYACEQEWCEEYENTVMRLFGWQPSRTVQYSVTVTLTTEVWLSDVIDLKKAFGSEYVDLDDQRYELEAQVTIGVAGTAGVVPTTEVVKRELEDNDYTFDDFTIVDWEINTDY